MKFSKTLLKTTGTASLCALASAFFSTANAHEAESVYTRPDGHAPIGVMGDHNHKAGEVMFSYRYGRMEMSDLQSGSDTLSPAEARGRGYMAAPVEMETEMHMFGAMVGVTDRLTLMAMGSWIDRSMTLQNAMNNNVYSYSEGFGDTKLNALYTLYDMPGRKKLLLTAGLSLPTGDITETGTSVNPNARLGYNMQNGSGTFDPSIAITFTEFLEDLSYGWQIGTTQRFYNNSEGYHLGDRYFLTGWTSVPVSRYVSFSGRLEAEAMTKINGADRNMNPMMATVTDAANSGYRRLNGYVGMNFTLPYGALKGHRLAVELGAPILRHYSGVQMDPDYRLVAGWQYAL